MRKYNDLLLSTIIKRHVPTYTDLVSSEKLNCSVHMDYLSICTSDIDKKFLNKYFMRSGTFYNNPHYKDCGYYVNPQSKIGFSLLLNKQKWNKSTFDHQIIIIPSHFEDQSKTFRLVLRLMGELNRENHKITRIDFSFLSKEITPSLIFYTALLKWKKRTTDFDRDWNAGNISGIRSHSSSINLSCYSSNSRYCASEVKERLREGMNNLEIQIKSRSLGGTFKIKTLFDLWRFQEMKSFFFLDFYDPTKSISTNYPSKRDRYRLFQQEVAFSGLNGAKFSFNKDNNLHRDILRSTPKLCINNDIKLSDCLKEELHLFLESWDQNFISNMKEFYGTAAYHPERLLKDQ